MAGLFAPPQTYKSSMYQQRTLVESRSNLTVLLWTGLHRREGTEIFVNQTPSSYHSLVRPPTARFFGLPILRPPLRARPSLARSLALSLSFSFLPLPFLLLCSHDCFYSCPVIASPRPSSLRLLLSTPLQILPTLPLFPLTAFLTNQPSPS